MYCTRFFLLCCQVSTCVFLHVLSNLCKMGMLDLGETYPTHAPETYPLKLLLFYSPKHTPEVYVRSIIVKHPGPGTLNIHTLCICFLRAKPRTLHSLKEILHSFKLLWAALANIRGPGIVLVIVKVRTYGFKEVHLE